MGETFKEKLTRIFRDSEYREILHGSAWSLGTKVVSLGAGYINTLLVARLLGAEVVGVNSLTVSFFAIVGLVAGLGFPTALVRFASQYENDSALGGIVRKVVLTSFLFASFVSLLVIIFSRWIALDVFAEPLLRIYFILYAVVFPFSVAGGEFIETIRGLRKINVSESIRNSMSLINFFSILLLYYVFKVRETLPAVANVIIVMTVFSVALIMFLKIFRKREIKAHSSVPFKVVLETALPLLLTSSMMVIIANTDKLMLGYFSNSKEVGIYSIAYKLSLLASIAVTSVNMILAPKISQLYWSCRIEELKRVVRFGARLFFYSSLPVMLLYLILPDFILGIFGKEFTAGKYVLIILSFSQMINAFSGPVGYFLMMTGREKVFRNIVV